MCATNRPRIITCQTHCVAEHGCHTHCVAQNGYHSHCVAENGCHTHGVPEVGCHTIVLQELVVYTLCCREWLKTKTAFRMSALCCTMQCKCNNHIWTAVQYERQANCHTKQTKQCSALYNAVFVLCLFCVAVARLHTALQCGYWVLHLGVN